MGFNTRVVLHVGGILLTGALLTWCLLSTGYYATCLTLALLLMLQIAALLRLVHTTNRELDRFLGAIRYADFSQSFSHQFPTGGSFRDLGRAFDAVLARFRSERSAREEQAAYLQVFVQQLPIAVLALAEDGRIPVSNHALRRLLGLKTTLNHLRQIDALDAGLGAFIANLPPGGGQSFQLTLPGRRLHLKFSCTLLRSRGSSQRLISIQDIQGELEARELAAWQNLIRVMTHEIMNSVTPVASLADTAEQLIGEAQDQLIAQPAPGMDALLPLLQDARDATGTIGRRSQGLLRFVESYRRLNRLPAPQPKTFRVASLLQSACTLMLEQAKRQDAELRVRCQPATLELHADPELLEQALINLLRNALEAVAGRPGARVELIGELRERGQVVLRVLDNGVGIPAEQLDSIFIPFFTTKRGGSGIGMSVVRQIARLNGASVQLHSTPNEGTEVTVLF